MVVQKIARRGGQIRFLQKPDLETKGEQKNATSSRMYEEHHQEGIGKGNDSFDLQRRDYSNHILA